MNLSISYDNNERTHRFINGLTNVGTLVFFIIYLYMKARNTNNVYSMYPFYS